MAQSIVRNLQGVAVSFQTSQIVNVRATTEGQLLQIFRSIQVGAANEMKPLALVQTKLSPEHRQINILKAFMISPTYWDSIVGSVTPDVLKPLNVSSLTSEFLLNGDRFNRVLSRLSPRQDRKDKTYEIDGTGQVDVGFPFVDTSLEVTGATATGSDPALGLVTFAIGDAGKLVEISFVTAPVYNVVRITRTHDQVEDHNGFVHPPYAYAMHPALADPLGITLPVV